MFQYDPKDASPKLIPDGSYDAQVLEVEETRTKDTKSAMLKLTVRVWANGGKFQLVDYIVNPGSLWKLQRLTKALGLDAEFKSGAFDPRLLIGKNFLAFVKTKKDESGKYPDSNVISKYSSSASPTASSDADDTADDLNF